jgi:hypothetical protein
MILSIFLKEEVQNFISFSRKRSLYCSDGQVGVGLMAFQQLGGINALGFYTSYIFSSAGI